MQHEAAVRYMCGWIDNRLTNLIKGVMNNINRQGKEEVIVIDSDGEEDEEDDAEDIEDMDNEEDDDDPPTPPVS